MVDVISRAHIDYQVNGHRHTGFSGDPRPVEFPTGDDLVEIELGSDGTPYGMTVPMFGGPVTARLHPSSPTTLWWMSEKQQWKYDNLRGRRLTIYNGSYQDAATGVKATLRGGTILNVPDMREPGQTYEAVIYYAFIAVEIDGVFVPVSAIPERFGG